MVTLIPDAETLAVRDGAMSPYRQSGGPDSPEELQLSPNVETLAVYDGATCSCRRSGGPDSPEKLQLTQGRGGRGARGKMAKARIAKACREGSEDQKDARFLYLSIDEAGTHVGKRHFRLLVRPKPCSCRIYDLGL